jgi:hypothetical protein
MDDFNFILWRSPHTGLTFVSADSVIGYLRRLSTQVRVNGDDRVADYLVAIADSFEEGFE